MENITVLFLSVLLISATAQDQCADNLVQALQTCASSINAGESLAMQQAKCSPNGCNYDRPAVDLINDLRADTWSMFTITNNTIDQVKQQIMADMMNMFSQMQEQKEKLTQLSQDVTTNITTLTNKTATNALNIGILQDKVSPLGFPCGSTGWTRVAFLDMTDSTQECPSELRAYDVDGVRACGRTVNNGASCTSVIFPVDISYSEVCGRVHGYQYASSDAIFPGGQGHNDLESTYLDGVSLTRGANPREHIWSFMAGVFEDQANAYTCPCYSGSPNTVQSFIGEDYFCESGSPSGWTTKLYSDDVLWDGKGCRSLEDTCCEKPGLPWFRKVFGDETSDDIELRVCGEESTNNEDSPVALYEIYVK